MNKIATIIFLLFMLMIAAFSIPNSETITFRVPLGNTYELPKYGLVLCAILAGALLMIVLVALRDTKRFINNYRDVKRQKKEERIEGLYSKALNAILSNDRADAEKILRDILRESPNHTKALLRMGDLMAKARRHEESAGFYRKALSSTGGRSLEALFSLEAQMRALSRWEEALAFAENILEIDADSLSALERKRFVLEKMENWPELIEVQKSILKHQDLIDAKKEEARLQGYRYECGRQGLEAGDMEKAGKHFRSVIKFDKDFVPAYLGTAEVLLYEGEPDEPVELLEKGYEQTGSVVVLARLEDLLLNLGEPDKAIEVYRKALNRKPGDPALKIMLAKLYYRLEMVDEALEMLKGFEAAENYPSLYGLLGELYLRREQFEKAARAFRKAIDVQPWRLFYSCGSCGHLATDWAGRCPGCGLWNTFSFDLYGRTKL